MHFCVPLSLRKFDPLEFPQGNDFEVTAVCHFPQSHFVLIVRFIGFLYALLKSIPLKGYIPTRLTVFT